MVNAIATFLTTLALAIIMSALLSLPVMWLWDCFVPAVFKLPEITWGQAWALSLLCDILFKSHTSVKTD